MSSVLKTNPQASQAKPINHRKTGAGMGVSTCSRKSGRHALNWYFTISASVEGACQEHRYAQALAVFVLYPGYTRIQMSFNPNVI